MTGLAAGQPVGARMVKHILIAHGGDLAVAEECFT
jgi:hypothetical protein